MRWSDTRKEASFYGVNYTLPFAHAYRAMNYLGIDHKNAIDRDVYHIARLGLNAYRIHIWDVEISDAKGNLIDNEHLELLDYLLMRLRERGIRIVITSQTNFGNGYPEHNKPTGGYSYNYDKCDIHRNPEAIAAQEKYISALINHINPNTGLAYKDDPYTVSYTHLRQMGVNPQQYTFQCTEIHSRWRKHYSFPIIQRERIVRQRIRYRTCLLYTSRCV